MTLGSHQKTIGDSQTWITPRWIIDALGPFDLDPCGAWPRPWNCAHSTIVSGGLEFGWFGRVWLNPPFHRYEVGKWIEKMAHHGNGTALVHARTEAKWFEPIWEKAKSIFFLSDRLHFHRPDGTRAHANSGAPACLVAFSDHDELQIMRAQMRGYLVSKWRIWPDFMDDAEYARIFGDRESAKAAVGPAHAGRDNDFPVPTTNG